MTQKGGKQPEKGVRSVQREVKWVRTQKNGQRVCEFPISHQSIHPVDS